MKYNTAAVLLLLGAALAGDARSQQVNVTWPPPNGSVGKIISVTGQASDPAGVTSVAVSIDGGAYSPVTALYPGQPYGWAYTVYAEAPYLSAGGHTLIAQETNANGAVTASSSLVFNVVYTNPVCAHSQAGPGIFCEEAASTVNGGAGPASVTFPNGFPAGSTIIVGAAVNNRNVPWVPGYLHDTANLAWTFWGNVGTGYLDDNLGQNGFYYVSMPEAITEPVTITAASPGAVFTILNAVVYTGVGAIDGAGGSNIGWGGPGLPNPTTGNYTVTPGDLNVAWISGAPTAAPPGWIERVEDYSRPYSMFVDQIAATSTANATWTMNAEGFAGIGLAFKPLRPKARPAPPVNRWRRPPALGGN